MVSLFKPHTTARTNRLSNDASTERKNDGSATSPQRVVTNRTAKMRSNQATNTDAHPLSGAGVPVSQLPKCWFLDVRSSCSFPP